MAITVDIDLAQPTTDTAFPSEFSKNIVSSITSVNDLHENKKYNEEMAKSSLGVHITEEDLRSSKPNHFMNTTENEIELSDSLDEDEDSGSEYLPFNKSNDLSFTSSLLREMESDESEKYLTLDAPSTSKVILAAENNLLPSTSSNTKLPNNNLRVPFVPKNFNFDGEVEKSRKTAVKNKRIWDKLDSCIFCEKQVTNFTRHILRKHKDETEVMKYETLPKGSADRKHLADVLRKRGNFLSNVEEGNKIKPVRRPYEFVTKPISNNTTKSNGRNRPQADGQNLLLTFTDTDEELVTKVFPRMASDNISFVAKSDKLIKAFGSRYLKCHKEKHLIAVVSQKMRTLARFLISVRSLIPEIHSLQECLTPKYFDISIKSAKQVAQYNDKTDSFGSPSVVLKIGQSLKQCCEIGEFILLKESDGLCMYSNEKNALNSIKYMIEKQWSFEISTNATKDIYQKKWNKPAILPLTSDIKLFRDYIVNVEKDSYEKLKLNHNNLQAYRELQESILAQIVLLNRRRSGEVQRILLDIYNNSFSEISQEEVLNALSPVELELTKSFKRIVIRGKRGRGVPVLFSPHLQKRLHFLTSLRETVCFIDKNNPYLFPLPQTSESCMRVSDIIRKFCKNAGVKHPENITSTRLRKHVATVTQLLNLSESDIEQLATFLGHTKDVHKEFYRLSDSAFQVAKMSKLLLMIEKGQGDQYRGKSIDEININVNDLISGESSDEEIIESPNQATSTPRNKNKLKITEKKIKHKITIIPWNDDEKSITTKYFKKYILLGKAPRKKECEEFLKINPNINRTWKSIKDFVHNTGNDAQDTC
ncbi:uncharacterized protein LOC126551137 [Aphis gossypii]|uniref:uncharacterized protein LOC126551137 n=1 Tax=Aphis gossypii TaxID=80765 RepID=UPI002158C28A|nr:uncharacterized protein LOC126551137 [Aphis gossypii]